jgi:metal-responsive CopG/Arc/MetJ family transcriptional regulator
VEPHAENRTSYDIFIWVSRLLSVSLPDDLSATTDAVAAAQGRSRSEVVRDALRSYLWREQWSQATREARARGERAGIGPEDVEDLVDELRQAG